MIGKLTGLIDEIYPGGCIINVNGVGYVVTCSSRALGAMPEPPRVGSMLIETHIRQDAITLYGFYDQAERTWFRMLTAIQGVGPKAALSMLSTLAPMDLAFAISADDKASLCRSPGVGQKLAIRVISELRDKVGALALEYGAAQPASVERDRPTSGLSADERDAVSALANLGWKAPEAHAAISRVKVGSSGPLGLSDLIRAGLKELSPR